MPPLTRRRRPRRGTCTPVTRTVISTAVSIWLYIVAFQEEERPIFVSILHLTPMMFPPQVMGATLGTYEWSNRRRHWELNVVNRGGATSTDDDFDSDNDNDFDDDDFEGDEESEKEDRSDKEDEPDGIDDSEEGSDTTIMNDPIETRFQAKKEMGKKAIGSFSAAFRMNEAVKEEALQSLYTNGNHVEEEEEEEGSDEANNNSEDADDDEDDHNDEIENEDSPPSNNHDDSSRMEEVSIDNTNDVGEGVLLGGAAAAAMVKPKPESRRQNNKFMADFDTSRVAPLSSRLLQEEDIVERDEENDENDVDEVSIEADEENDEDKEREDVEALVVPEKSTRGTSATRNITDVGKLWWVNVRQIYLSEAQEANIDDERSGDETDDLTLSDSSVSTAEEEEEEEADYFKTEAMEEKEDVDDSLLDGVIVAVEDEETIDLDESVEKEDGQKLAQAPTANELKVLGASELLSDAELEEPSDLVVFTGRQVSPYASSGVWYVFDNILTLGLASQSPAWRLSRGLRGVRKLTARVTGLHGILSGKPRGSLMVRRIVVTNSTSIIDSGERDEGITEVDGEMSEIRSRLAAIDRAREGVERAMEADSKVEEEKIGWFRRMRREMKSDNDEEIEDINVSIQMVELKELEEEEARKKEQEAQEEFEKQQRELEQKQREMEEKQKELEDRRRMDRVKEIDKLMLESQAKLQELACEKDVLQRRPNPLWNYTTKETPKAPVPLSSVADDDGDQTNTSATDLGIQASRKFNFPPDDLVEEYLEMMFSSGRLIRMNHTFLWKDSELQDDDDDETIGDDLLTPSADAHKLYKEKSREEVQNGRRKNGRHKNGGGGSWLLRQSIAGGPSLGEKIGETAEKAAYKAICAAVMSFLARTLSSLHGINVMKYSDIRLVLESAPDLPPLGAGVIPGSSENYAQEAIKTVIRKKSKSKKQKKRSHRALDDSFLQRDAVTEMLLSHVQISAPLLKLFPLAWQRAFLGNIITLSTAVMSDFFDGLQFQILGHHLSFAFKPITEADMISHLGFSGRGFNNHRRARPEQFEAAVRATAADVSEELKFLDRWHERALGSGVLRTQIANLIARIVLTLADEVLSGARMDLWSAPAGGPRMLAGLEYRTKKSNRAT